MSGVRRGHIFGAGLDRWIEGNCGAGLEEDEPILRICCMCLRQYQDEESALDPICPDCIEATAVCDWED